MYSIIDDIILLNYIDSGCFAEIYLSKKEGSDALLATKKIGLKYVSLEPLFKMHLQNEIKFLKEFNHQNIIKLYDVKITNDNIYLIMEFCNGGSLKKALRNYIQKFGKPFTEDIVRFFMKQILSAVEYLHRNGFVHRDLKLDNILLKYDTNNENEENNYNYFFSQIKIIDFNISERINSENNIDKDSPMNINQEIGANIVEVIDDKIDIWALGMLCYEMLIGTKMLSDGYDIKELYSVSIPQNISLSAQTFLLSMLQVDKNKRLSAKELLKHDFITKGSTPIERPLLSAVKNKSENNLMIYDSNPIERPFLTEAKKKPEKSPFDNIYNTPMDNYKKKIIFPENGLRFSAKVNHRRVPSIFSENKINPNKENTKSLPLKKEQAFNPNRNNNNNNNKNKYVCKINIVGKNIYSNHLKVIVDSCIQTYLQNGGKIATAKKSANLIKKLLGGNWLVFLSSIENNDFDFCFSPGKKENFISFVFCDKLFQIFRYN